MTNFRGRAPSGLISREKCGGKSKSKSGTGKKGK